MSVLRRTAVQLDAAEFASACAELDPIGVRIMNKLLERVIELQARGADDEVFALLDDLETALASQARPH